MSRRIIHGAIYLALHPVREMKWLKIWNLTELLTNCDNPCVQKIISGAVYLAFHPVRQMEWLIIWKLSKSLTKCESLYVQKNPTILCSLFGSPSSNVDEVAEDMESNGTVDKM